MKQAILTLSGVLLLALTPVTQGQVIDPNLEPTPSELQNLIDESGYSISDLQMLGIDLNDPESAVTRARSLGIPENQIRKFVEVYQQQGSSSGSATAIPSGTIPTMMDSLRPMTTLPGDVQYSFPSISDSTITKTRSQAIRDSVLAKDVLVAQNQRFKGLSYFGYSVFRNQTGDFAAMKNGPADPGYVVGAGDVIRLYLWGDVEFQYELPVDNNGNIYIPKVGQFFASGMTLETLRSQLRTFLSRQYSGLKASPPTVFIDVNLAFVKGTEVYLMGDVLNPGSYSLSGFATAFNLMYASKGAKTSGSLRELRIIREGKIAARVDLYDYLAFGQPTNDQRLRNGDILFIPPRGNTAAITGEILRPAIYEMRKGETLKDLIELAGGVKTFAYSFRVQIDRIVPLEKRVPEAPTHEVLDFNLVDILNGKQKVAIEDGDKVNVLSIVDEMKDYVDVVGGGITHPGRYQLSRVKTVKDLIKAAEGLTDDAYPYKADLVRTRPDLTKMMLTLDLNEAMKGNPKDNLTLESRDSLYVFGRLEWEIQPKVSLRGFVTEPGEYLYPDSMTVYDLLFEHSGLQDSLRWQQTFLDRGDIYRLTDDGMTREQISFNIADIWNKIPGSNISLKNNDIVIVYDKLMTKLFKRQISISGSVRNPGDYELADNMSLADLVVLAGGFTEDAWVLQAEVSRIDLGGLPEGTLARIITVPLVDWNNENPNPESYIPELARNKTAASEFTLQPYDQVRIRKNPDYKLPGNVELRGEVMFPGSYTLRHENESLSEVIDRAGGLKPTAHISGGQLLRDNQRLFLDFKELLVKKDKKEDVILHPNDVIFIPEKPNAVTVIGAVINPGIYKYIEGKRAKDYLKEAGGKTRDGDRIYLTQPSGRTYEVATFKNPKVEDGGIVRVVRKKKSEKTEIDYAGIIKDSMSVISAALTIIVLATRLN